eukprot:g9392.t1
MWDGCEHEEALELYPMRVYTDETLATICGNKQGKQFLQSLIENCANLDKDLLATLLERGRKVLGRIVARKRHGINADVLTGLAELLELVEEELATIVKESLPEGQDEPLPGQDVVITVIEDETLRVQMQAMMDVAGVFAMIIILRQFSGMTWPGIARWCDHSQHIYKYSECLTELAENGAKKGLSAQEMTKEFFGPAFIRENAPKPGVRGASDAYDMFMIMKPILKKAEEEDRLARTTKMLTKYWQDFSSEVDWLTIDMRDIVVALFQWFRDNGEQFLIQVMWEPFQIPAAGECFFNSTNIDDQIKDMRATLRPQHAVANGIATMCWAFCYGYQLYHAEHHLKQTKLSEAIKDQVETDWEDMCDQLCEDLKQLGLNQDRATEQRLPDVEREGDVPKILVRLYNVSEGLEAFDRLAAPEKGYNKTDARGFNVVCKLMRSVAIIGRAAYVKDLKPPMMIPAEITNALDMWDQVVTAEGGEWALIKNKDMLSTAQAVKSQGGATTTCIMNRLCKNDYEPALQWMKNPQVTYQAATHYLTHNKVGKKFQIWRRYSSHESSTLFALANAKAKDEKVAKEEALLEKMQERQEQDIAEGKAASILQQGGRARSVFGGAGANKPNLTFNLKAGAAAKAPGGVSAPPPPPAAEAAQVGAAGPAPKQGVGFFFPGAAKAKAGAQPAAGGGAAGAGGAAGPGGGDGGGPMPGDAGAAPMPGGLGGGSTGLGGSSGGFATAPGTTAGPHAGNQHHFAAASGVGTNQHGMGGMTPGATGGHFSQQAGVPLNQQTTSSQNHSAAGLFHPGYGLGGNLGHPSSTNYMFAPMQPGTSEFAAKTGMPAADGAEHGPQSGAAQMQRRFRGFYQGSTAVPASAAQNSLISSSNPNAAYGSGVGAKQGQVFAASSQNVLGKPFQDSLRMDVDDDGQGGLLGGSGRPEYVSSLNVGCGELGGLDEDPMDNWAGLFDPITGKPVDENGNEIPELIHLQQKPGFQGVAHQYEVRSEEPTQQQQQKKPPGFSRANAPGSPAKQVHVKDEPAHHADSADNLSPKAQEVLGLAKPNMEKTEKKNEETMSELKRKIEELQAEKEEEKKQKEIAMYYVEQNQRPPVPNLSEAEELELQRKNGLEGCLVNRGGEAAGVKQELASGASVIVAGETGHISALSFSTGCRPRQSSVLPPIQEGEALDQEQPNLGASSSQQPFATAAQIVGTPAASLGAAACPTSEAGGHCVVEGTPAVHPNSTAAVGGGPEAEVQQQEESGAPAMKKAKSVATSTSSKAKSKAPGTGRGKR